MVCITWNVIWNVYFNQNQALSPIIVSKHLLPHLETCPETTPQRRVKNKVTATMTATVTSKQPQGEGLISDQIVDQMNIDDEILKTSDSNPQENTSKVNLGVKSNEGSTEFKHSIHDSIDRCV